MPVRSAIELQFDDNDLVSVKNRELALAGSPSLNLNDKTAQVTVNTAAGDGAVGVQLPNRGNALLNAPRVEGLPDTSVRRNPQRKRGQIGRKGGQEEKEEKGTDLFFSSLLR